MIGSPRAYLSFKRRGIMWVSKYFIQFEPFVIGYLRHSHVNYARFNHLIKFNQKVSKTSIMI